MRRALLLSVLLSLVVSGTSVAQTCLGMPSFTTGRFLVGAGGAFDDGSTSYVGTVGYGSPRSFFGTAGYGRTEYDGVDASFSNLNLGAGYHVPLGDGRAEVCPLASLSLGWGPDDIIGPGVDVSNRTIAAGAGFGLRVGSGSQVQFVPNASLLFASTRLELDDGINSAADSESYAALTLGTGFLFASRVGLNPTMTIPIGLGDSDPSFGVTAAIHFGH